MGQGFEFKAQGVEYMGQGFEFKVWG